MSIDDLAFEETERALQTNDMHHASVQLEKLGTIVPAITHPKFWALSAVYALLTLNISEVEHSLRQAETLKGWDEKYFLDVAEAAVRKRLERRKPHFLFRQRKEDVYRTDLSLELARCVERYRTS